MRLNLFPKRMRLSGRSAVSRVFAEGQSGFVYPFRYVFTAESVERERAGVAVLVTVSKKYHKRANKRNILKRRTREAFRLIDKELIAVAEGKGVSIHIALMYSTKDILEFKNISDAVGKILGQIGQRV